MSRDRECQEHDTGSIDQEIHHSQIAEGVVTAILDNDTQVEDLTLCDVEFEFGVFTLYCTQLEPARILAK